jgi:vacuolar-type H+-ATPase subunit H
LEIYDLCVELQNELNGRKGFVNNQVDVSKCRDLIALILERLPFFIRDVENVINNRVSILENADTVAKNVLKEAEDRASRMVSESEIVRAAEERGKSIVDGAYKKCDELVLATKDRLDGILKETETLLKNTLRGVSENRYEIKGLLINSNKE